MKVCPLDPDFKKKVIEMGAFELHEFEIMVEFGAGICSPGKEKYKIRV